jgi:hypothetical protein
MVRPEPHIVWLVQNALSGRDRDRFGVEFFARRGTRVTVLDLADLLQPRLTHKREHYALWTDIAIRVISSAADLAGCLETLRGASLIISTAEGGHVTPRNRAVLALVGRSGAPWMTLSANAYPGWSRYGVDSPSPMKRLRDLIGRLGNVDLAASLVGRLPHSWMGIRPATFNVVGGRKSFRSTFVGPETRVIQGHAMDYDIFLAERAKGLAQEDIAVFVDEFRPFHPDLKATGVSVPVEANEYYPPLCRLFDRVEAQTGLKVVIAANPRADYSKMPEVYGRRELHYFKTAELIGRSRLVLGHRSTALAFGVLFGRPITLLATDKLYRHVSQRPYFDGYAEAIGKPVVFMDDPDAADLSGLMDMDTERYAAFITDYVKQPGSPEMSYWEIVAEALVACSVLPDTIMRAA